MPELTRHVTAVCASALRFEHDARSSSGGTYRVCYGKLSPPEQVRQGYQYGWTCECKGFQHRARCRHIDTAKEVRERMTECRWNEELDVMDAPNGACPSCGGHVEFVEVAV